MAYWVKVEFERNKYIIDLDQISAFVCTPNGKITLWLPNGSMPIIVNRQNKPDDYQQVQSYINKLSAHSLLGSWIKLLYDRCEYLIDLDRISTFCYSNNQKLTFWLPESSTPIVITKQANPQGYQKVITFILRKTGQSIP
ncbi:MAG: hypothetical protein F6K10_20515 [Moorea sp. SIO2B7]|nr:hypothetical protein [Moorena sp. SIO2B7]